MSSELSGEQLLSSIESELKGVMPEECYNMFKRLSLCQLERNDEILKTKGRAGLSDLETNPYGRVEGCKNEYNAYHKCYFDFKNRYFDMKNYVAEIEGKTKPFDKQQLEREMRDNNIGLNKF